MNEAEKLAEWWHARAQSEIEATIPKAIEYGSQDLVDMGHDAAGLVDRKVDDAEAMEIAIWFYLRGKLARWSAAIRRGERVSDDTVFDIGVYARMVQRIREVGSWPGIEPVQEELPFPGRDDIVWEDQGGDPATAGEHYESADQLVGTNGSRFTNGKKVIDAAYEHSRHPEFPPPVPPPLPLDNLRDLVERFRVRLFDAGWQDGPRVGEIVDTERAITVTTQYAGGEIEVKAWRGIEERPFLVSSIRAVAGSAKLLDQIYEKLNS